MRAMQIRQGDVFLQRTRRRQRRGAAVVDGDRVILAYGEVTGHAHEVIDTEQELAAGPPPAALFEEPAGRRFLFVDRPCALVHQEHGAIQLEPGCYEVIRQREYTPEAIRTVAD